MTAARTILAAAGLIAGASIALAQPAPNVQGPGQPHPKPSAAQSPGEATFLAKCRYCHVEMGPGTVTLAKRLGEKNALLANRTDLDAAYVKTVVRNGLNSMPAINRVEVSDAELNQIAAYLTRKKR